MRKWRIGVGLAKGGFSVGNIEKNDLKTRLNP